MKVLVAESITLHTSEIPTPSNMLNFVVNNKNLLCKALLEAENGKIFRERLLPLVLEKYKDDFVEFASGIVAHSALVKNNFKMFCEITLGENTFQQFLG